MAQANAETPDNEKPLFDDEVTVSDTTYELRITEKNKDMSKNYAIECRTFEQVQALYWLLKTPGYKEFIPDGFRKTGDVIVHVWHDCGDGAYTYVKME